MGKSKLAEQLCKIILDRIMKIEDREERFNALAAYHQSRKTSGLFKEKKKSRGGYTIQAMLDEIWDEHCPDYWPEWDDEW